MSILRATLVCMLVATASPADEVTISKERFIDKCRGAWAGQMAGVSFGAPHEFQSNGAMIEKDLDSWTPGRISNSIDQDDVYVEMTFLKALEEHGLGITYEQAGKAFADSQYPLWHANRVGRDNCRQGIMPPMSGHPLYNRHADDIDFQIEADLFGILSPGLPNESNAMCEVFGRIMNYGDGLYGGMFVSGMYAAAYFEDKDVRKVVQAGLDCIPKESLYHQCISDIVAWHAANPKDWKATWKLIEDKWQDDIDCSPGNPFNIDAKMNGAYIVMGLLYGEGDFAKTIEVSTRCGQDADCNPSNAAGVLGCMLGYSKIDPVWTSGIEGIKDTEFSHTNYSFTTLIPTCQGITEALIVRAGGRVEGDAYVIPVQKARPPDTIEQWTDQMRLIGDVIPADDMEAWMPGWRVLSCGSDMEPGIKDEAYGKKNVLLLHPVSQEKAAVLVGEVKVPNGGQALEIEIASHESGNFLLRVEVNNAPVIEKVIDTKGTWVTERIDLNSYSSKVAPIRIEIVANDWSFEAAYIARIALK